ncbi:MAG: hypothetical protein MJ096_06960 [Clostridia bacterium]|nr:hypothetical protein [Clostridia bacterium]
MQFYISTNDEYLDRTVKALADGAGCPAVISRFDGESGDDVCAVVGDCTERPSAEYVIVISGYTAATDEKTYLVSRPVDLEALRNVIIEVSRRGNATASVPVVWSRSERCVSKGELSVVLSPRESELFELLYRAGGAPVSRDEIGAVLGGGSSNVAVHVCYLRRRLEPLFGEGFLGCARGSYFLKL